MKVNQFAERLIKSLKIKIYKKLTANDIKSCLGFLNELIDKCNNSYHRSISKKGIYADYFALNNEIKKILKPLKLMLVIELGIIITRIFLVIIIPRIGE